MQRTGADLLGHAEPVLRSVRSGCQIGLRAAGPAAGLGWYTRCSKESGGCRLTEGKNHHRDTEQKERVIILIFVSVPLW